MGRALGGDLGSSLVSGESVTRAINARLPVTRSLIIGSLLVSVIVGVGLGSFSAVRAGAPDRAVDAFALVGFALPSFWIGAVLILSSAPAMSGSRRARWPRPRKRRGFLRHLLERRLALACLCCLALVVLVAIVAPIALPAVQLRTLFVGMSRARVLHPTAISTCNEDAANAAAAASS